jgi:hypothetical protein
MKPFAPSRLFSSLGGVALAATSLVAQTPLYTVPGLVDGDRDGFRVTFVGDLNGDGYSDFAVGAPYADLFGFTDAGRLRLYSGRTGLRYRQFRGDHDLDECGYAVAGIGDVDGDGHDDVAFTQRKGRLRYFGEVWITSGYTGRTIFRLFGERNAYDYYGNALAGLGDVDGDGYGDFAVGSPGRDAGGHNAGLVEVYSGKKRTLIWQLTGTASLEDFGAALAGVGDVDGDGYGDLLVGAPRYDVPGKSDAGRASLHSGRTGAVIRTFDGFAWADRFGTSVAGVGDMDGDGVPDVAVGSPFAAGGLGRAQVYSAATGALLFDFVGSQAGDQLGASLAGGGDVDGDGIPEVLVGAPGFDGAGGIDCGCAYLMSGATGFPLALLDGESSGDGRGFAVAGGGDVDADGYADYVVGAPFRDLGGVDLGVAEIFAPGGTGTPGRVYYLEKGCPGSDGSQPRIELLGRPVLGGSYEAIVRGGLGNSPAVLNFGPPSNTPLGAIAPDCVLYTRPFDQRGAMTDADGLARVVPFASIPVIPAIVGVEILHQWIVVDPLNNQLGVSVSDAGLVVLGQ